MQYDIEYSIVVHSIIHRAAARRSISSLYAIGERGRPQRVHARTQFGSGMARSVLREGLGAGRCRYQECEISDVQHNVSAIVNDERSVCIREQGESERKEKVITIE